MSFATLIKQIEQFDYPMDVDYEPEHADELAHDAFRKCI